MTRTTETRPPLPDISIVKLVISFTVGMLIGFGLVFSIIRANFSLSLTSLGSFGAGKTVLLLAVLGLFITFLGVLVLFDY